MTQKDTICALSSAPGRAAVAVIRVSGPLAGMVLERLTGRLPAPRKAALCRLRAPDTGEDIDHALVLYFAGPSSETGEDVAEIQTHGGRAVVAGVLATLVGLGCRLAEPGEFARRAFENGKIDLAQAEGIADLVDAETEAQRRQAVRQAGGALSRLYDGWRQEIVTAMALLEAAIDFSDEADVASDAVAQAVGIAGEAAKRIGAHLDDGRRGEILRDGFRVVLAGAPNVGKSSLLNALARREAAIVSAEPGTTRDVIEVRLDLAGLPVIVADTAGIRDAGGEVEREGIRRTFMQARDADLVLWVTDARAPEWDAPAGLGGSVLRVANKVDLIAGRSSPGSSPPQQCRDTAAGKTPDIRAPAVPDARIPGTQPSGLFSVSAATGDGLPELVRRIAEIARERIGSGDDIAITQARHRAALEDCRRSLLEIACGNVPAVELAAEDLRRAAQALGRITGKVDAEMVLDLIFGRFCIGK